MNAFRIAAIVLIVAGVLALVYGKFSFTRETHRAKVGSIDISVEEKETVNVPAWAGVGAVAAGTLMLLLRRNG